MENGNDSGNYYSGFRLHKVWIMEMKMEITVFLTLFSPCIQAKILVDRAKVGLQSAIPSVFSLSHLLTSSMEVPFLSGCSRSSAAMTASICPRHRLFHTSSPCSDYQKESNKSCVDGISGISLMLSTGIVDAAEALRSTLPPPKPHAAGLLV